MSHNSVFKIIGVFFIDSNMITVIVELFVAPNALLSLAFDELSNAVDSDDSIFKDDSARNLSSEALCIPF